MSTMLPDPPPATVLPPQQQLARNPQLPQSPLGAYTDAQYEAAVSALRSNIAKQYADVLQQLGYQDDQGNFIMGSVEDEANRNKADLSRSLGIADENVTKQHQQDGTLFSGLRGTDQARAEYPYIQQTADIDRTTPLTLQKLYEQGSGLISDYTNQQNSLLADAAGRRAASLQASGGDATPSTPAPVSAQPAPGVPVAQPPISPTVVDHAGGGLVPIGGATTVNPALLRRPGILPGGWSGIGQAAQQKLGQWA